jgi:hypothetical protein
MSKNECPLAISGVKIAEPLSKLKKKFGFDADYVPFGLYDGYRTPAERAGNRNILELEDLLITVAMNSRIGAGATWSFWDGVTGQEAWYVEANRLLAKLPHDLDLADATDGQVEGIMGLFQAFCSVTGIKTAVAAKMLCRKRPRSVPMLDSFVLPIACHLALIREGVRDFEPLPWSAWYDIDRALRQLRAMCIEGKDTLSTICRAFGDLPGNPELSPLRALESLLWWEATQEPEIADPHLLECAEIMGWRDG